MKVYAFALLAVGLLACGDAKQDELGPYVQKLIEEIGRAHV